MSQSEIIKIKGVALRAGISRNNVFYGPEEMKLTSHELANKPILMDHESKSTGVIGKTTKAEFMPSENAIYYEGWIKEDGHGVVERIKDGRLETVSIGAMCDELLEDEDKNFMIAKGIHYMELSTTPTPGVLGTSLKQSLNDDEKLRFSESVDKFENIFSGKQTGTMPKDNQLRLVCPANNCSPDMAFDNIEGFEKHMMDVHKWTDYDADEYLRRAGVLSPEEETGEHPSSYGQNPGTDVAVKQGPVAQDPLKKQPYESESMKILDEKKSEIQSLIFSKDKFDLGKAKMWAKDHDFRADKIDDTEDSIRLRQKEPAEFDSFRTIELEDGVKAVLGIKNESKKMEEEKMSEEKKVLENDIEIKKAEEEKLKTKEMPPMHDDDMDVKKKKADSGEEGDEDEEEDEGGAPVEGKKKVMKVSQSVDLKKQLEARDVLIESLAKEVEKLKQKTSEKVKEEKVERENKVEEKGLVNVKEVSAAGDKTYEADNIRFERLDNGKWSFWRLPTGPNGTYK